MIGNKKILLMGMALLFGCGSVERAELNSQNPKDAIVELNSIREDGLSDQVDLLAAKEFKKGEETLEDAIDAYRKDGDREEALLELAESKAIFLNAREIADKREAIPRRILTARRATLENGIREDHDQIEDLNEVDKNLIWKTRKFSKNLDVKDLSEIEQKYLKLEVEAVQNRELRTSRQIVNNAKDYDAEKLAPKTYRKAANLLNAAENMIQQSPRNPENYRNSVAASEKSATLLNDVMDKLRGVASGASETAALEMVQQDRKVGNLSERAGNLQGELFQSQSNLSSANNEIELKERQALIADGKVLNQNVINDMRNFFTKEEADVYQQGSDLIIRLKTLDFNVGSSEIPNDSTGLLAKVNSVIMNLNSQNIVVEGHTDSTGGDVLNKGLSVARSQAVAKHLQSIGTSSYEVLSEGFGASRPIANNQSAAGRALNRRVDIVVKTN